MIEQIVLALTAVMFGMGISMSVIGCVLIHKNFYTGDITSLKLGFIGFVFLSIGATFLFSVTLV